MKSLFVSVICATGVLLMLGCSTPGQKTKDLELKMTADDVEDIMGEPDAIRAAKVYETGETTKIWEYEPPWFVFNPKTYWVYFVNGEVVQWGEPGDFADQAGDMVPVTEYFEQKKVSN